MIRITGWYLVSPLPQGKMNVQRVHAFIYSPATAVAGWKHKDRAVFRKRWAVSTHTEPVYIVGACCCGRAASTSCSRLTAPRSSCLTLRRLRLHAPCPCAPSAAGLSPAKCRLQFKPLAAPVTTKAGGERGHKKLRTSHLTESSTSVERSLMCCRL